jgi:hypothetical protein
MPLWLSKICRALVTKIAESEFRSFLGFSWVSLKTLNNIRARLYMYVHCKKRLAIFPSPAVMSLTKLSQAGNNLIIPSQGELG